MTCYDKFLEKLKTIQYLKSLQKLRNQHGAVFALTALLLPVLFGFMGLGYDVGNLYLHKARLQDTADATSLAGARGYVNELKKGSSTGVISLPKNSSDTQTKKSNAIAALKTNADNYIANNNPVFQDKLNNDNRTEKFYWIGKELTSSDRNNSTEYFRVVLSEPVQLYFLPVIGIKSSADVSVYATTKLSDNEIVKGQNNSNPQEAEHKPVVIAGNMFYDDKNTSIPAPDPNENYEGKTLQRNSYNVSNVYISNNGNTGHMSAYVYSTIDDDGNRITDPANIQTVAIQKVDYDLNKFGEEIRKLFREKAEGFYNADPTKKALLDDYKIQKANWEKGEKEYNEAYTAWLASGTPSYSSPSSYSEMTEICNLLEKYKSLCYPHEVPNSDRYANALQQWENDGKPLVGTESDFENLMKSGYQYYYEQPNEGNWQSFIVSSSSSGKNPFNIGNNGNGLGILTINGERSPVLSAFTSKYTTFDHKPDLYNDYGLDEYYMTYRGTRSNILSESWSVDGSATAGNYLSTLKISTDPSQFDSHLPSNEHSYFYLSKAAYSHQESSGGSFDILVDGFYQGEDTFNEPYKDENGEWKTRQVTRKYTTDTPFYLFLEEDFGENVHIEFKADCNRPLIFCFFGPEKVHSGKSTGRTIKGIFYMPNNDTDSHANWEHVTFSGSIVAKNWHFQNGYNDFRYNPTEVAKWQENKYKDENGVEHKQADGLPVTPNYGFSDSSSTVVDPNVPPVDTEKITIPDHLRLVLASSITDDSHYNQARVSWTLIE